MWAPDRHASAERGWCAVMLPPLFGPHGRRTAVDLDRKIELSDNELCRLVGPARRGTESYPVEPGALRW